MIEPTVVGASGQFDRPRFLVLRTPLLPFHRFSDWSKNCATRLQWLAGAPLERLREVFDADVRSLREQLAKALDDAAIRQAILVASPSAEASIARWRSDPDSRKGKRAEETLVRYFARMCARSTPFGLFSGCSTLDVVTRSGDRRLSLAGRESYRASSRLDFEYLFRRAHQISKDPSIQRRLRFDVNASLRRVGSAWVGLQNQGDDAAQSYHLVRFDSDDSLECVIARARGGALLEELGQALRAVSPPETSDAEIFEYLNQLIENQVLVSALTPGVTGPPAIDTFLHELQVAAPEVAEELSAARDALAWHDRQPIGVSPDWYRDFARRLKGTVDGEMTGRLVQVDLFKPATDVNIDQRLLDAIAEAVDVWFRFSREAENEDLRTFRDEFIRRFGNAWIPLVQALDEESGVGFGAHRQRGSRIVRDLQLGGDASKVPPRKPTLPATLLAKLAATATSPDAEIVLRAEDFPSRRTPVPLPPAIGVGFSLIGSPEDLARGEFRVFLRSVTGPSGVQLFGRFCYGDAALDAYVREFIRCEEDASPDAAFAEIVYLPEGRLGNVLARPVHRQFEIPCLGRPGVALDRQIDLADILVTVTEDRRIVCYSQRLEREVIPRLTNAHGYSGPHDPVYRFLCHLQSQLREVGGFSWGTLDSLDTLPRVVVGNVVVAPRTWRLSPEELEPLLGDDPLESYLSAQRLRDKRALPRMVVFAQSDNHLHVDFDNPLSVTSFASLLRPGTAAQVSETLPADDKLCVRGPEGGFRHELMAPMLFRGERKPAVSAAARPVAPVDTVLQHRIRVPGGDWCSMKWYCTSLVADEFLVERVGTALRQGVEIGKVSKWFFVRYADPRPHLRIRVLGVPGYAMGELLPRLLSDAWSVLERPLATSVELSPYVRELERYGGVAATDIAEELFCADSQAALDCISRTRADEGIDTRWQLALLGTDRLFADLGFAADVRREVAETMRDRLRAEFNVGKRARIQMGDKYRVLKSRLTAALDGNAPPDSLFGAADAIFATRSLRTKACGDRLRDLLERGECSHKLTILAQSYAHMHVNRLLPDDQRLTEMLIYDFLVRLYAERSARISGRARSS